ncbi:MAG: hypothetical protein EBU46_11950 [Nitrosomonadaceae bacterium]|nr:hypothetical protein [Nitrosomonadaceae bacterium]
MSNYSLNSSSFRHEDASLLLFYLVVTASALYMLQRYSAFVFAAEYRLMLYALLGVVVLVLRRKLVCVPLAFWVLSVAVAWSGVHTYLLSDAKLAIHATSRFANVMMLAPMAAVLLLHNRQLEKIFQILMAIFLLAMGTLLYQYCGWGELNRLVQGYIAIRGDLVRFMTVVGEPNVGGMLASIVLVLGIALSKRRFIAVLWGSLAVAFVTFSLSKAAFLGVGVGLLAGGLLYGPNERPELLFRITASGATGLALIWILGADDYIRVMVDSVLGSIRGEPSALEDFRFRQSSIDWNAIFIQSATPHWFSYLFGASFFNVGSAALEIRGPDVGVVLPHNSYLELFFTGGLLLLGLVLFLMVHAAYTLFNSRGTGSWQTDRCALICLAMLAAWMLVIQSSMNRLPALCYG